MYVSIRLQSAITSTLAAAALGALGLQVGHFLLQAVDPVQQGLEGLQVLAVALGRLQADVVFEHDVVLPVHGDRRRGPLQLPGLVLRKSVAGQLAARALGHVDVVDVAEREALFGGGVFRRCEAGDGAQRPQKEDQPVRPGNHGFGGKSKESLHQKLLL